MSEPHILWQALLSEDTEEVCTVQIAAAVHLRVDVILPHVRLYVVEGLVKSATLTFDKSQVLVLSVLESSVLVSSVLESSVLSAAGTSSAVPLESTSTVVQYLKDGI